MTQAVHNQLVPPPPQVMWEQSNNQLLLIGVSVCEAL